MSAFASIADYERFARFQQDGRDRLASDPLLRAVPVLVQKIGNIENDVLVALGTMNAADGKSGACIVVLMPELDVTAASVDDVVGEMMLTARCLCMPVINDDATSGTGLDAGVLATRALAVWQGWLQKPHPRRVVQAKGPGIEPYTRDHTKGITGFDVTVRTPMNITAAKVAAPVAALSGGNVELTCPTSGAAIYWTQDGSYPGSGNPTATLYTAPFAPTGTVRAGAETDTGVPSDPITFIP